MEEPGIILLSGNYAQLRPVGHRGGLIPQALRRQKEKTDFSQTKFQLIVNQRERKSYCLWSSDLLDERHRVLERFAEVYTARCFSNMAALVRGTF